MQDYDCDVLSSCSRHEMLLCVLVCGLCCRVNLLCAGVPHTLRWPFVMQHSSPHMLHVVAIGLLLTLVSL